MTYHLTIGTVALFLMAGASQAEGLWLTGPTTQCRGLEAMVVYGFVDGGEGGDTTELTAVVDSGDDVACMEWMEGYGYPGLYNPDCAEAFDILWVNGLPEWLEGEEFAYLTDLFAPSAPDTCANILFDLTAGQ